MANSTEPSLELEPQPKLSACCISHLFLKAASKSPEKIAVIHAFGGAKIISEQFHNNFDTNQQATLAVTDEEFIESKTASSSSSPAQPLVYEGDKCFTYSEILSAVNSLSSRIKRILAGADDPQLSKPQSGYLHCEQKSTNDRISGSAECSSPSVQQVNKFRTKYTPRIIGIYMEPSVEYIVSVLAVLRCGEAFMPLDPSWPRERILTVVSSSKVDLVIGCEYLGDDGYFHQLDKLHWLVSSGYCPVLCMSMSNCVQDLNNLCDLDWPCEIEMSRLFCYLMYTSGSTGKPKGVCGTESGLLNRFLWMQDLYPLHGEEYLVFKTSISFIDHLQEVLTGILTTCTIIVPPFNELKENILFVVDFLQMYAINRLVAVPSLMRAVLLPLQSPRYVRLRRYLKVLVLSGEVLQVSLCKSLLKLLPHTAVLNLYGSTEVSGDCTYFDCKQLLMILENEIVGSVPIGLPIYNCDVVLVGENTRKYGEIYVRGLCNAAGYFDHPSITPFDHFQLPQGSCFSCTYSDNRLQYYFKTGDFARQLESGVLIFIGREDRTIKFNGQRISLEEIESTLMEHPDIVNAAVICQKDRGESSHIEAHLVLKQKENCNANFQLSIRSWMVNKLPQAVVPSRFFFTESFPISSSGKVDYNLLPVSSFSNVHSRSAIGEMWDNDLLKVITKVFCDVLLVEEVSIGDNFFDIGGNSVSAASVAYKLGINMKLLYTCPTPLKLQMVLRRNIGSFDGNPRIDANMKVDSGATDENFLPARSSNASQYESEPRRRLLGAVSYSSTDRPVKHFKKDLSLSTVQEDDSPKDNCFWNANSLHTECSFSRSNKSTHSKAENNNFSLPVLSKRMSRRKGRMQKLWKVHMESCVDASPLIICKGNKVYLFIGSHSGKFVCVDAKSGFVFWEIKLEGRTECSASVLDDFSQVVVGCYEGNIYFLHLLDGNICWIFRTGGEVKSQPLVDKQRHLVWCGSYDHNLYGLDYKGYSCSYKISCGGSIFSAPALDEMRDKLFVASTNGLVTAISIKATSCCKLWIQDFEAPVFGSLSINCPNGNVICCLVDGNVVAVDTDGAIIWKASCDGPIFAGPSISESLPSQVIVCSRDGSIYSFEMEKGDLVWKHNVGCPITSSAYVDENLQLTSDFSHLSDRLVCVCTTSGTIIVLCIDLDTVGTVGTRQQEKAMVQEFAKLELEGDIFSSPVMIGGKIFVGCRDDYLYCIGIEPSFSV